MTHILPADGDRDLMPVSGEQPTGPFLGADDCQSDEGSDTSVCTSASVQQHYRRQRQMEQ